MLKIVTLPVQKRGRLVLQIRDVFIIFNRLILFLVTFLSQRQTGDRNGRETVSAGERAPEKEGYREMSLVDYASSSDEDEEAEPIQEQQLHSQVPLAPNPDPPLPQTQ